MSRPARWRERLFEELRRRLPSAGEPHDLRPADAHRLLVLIGRYAQWRARYPDDAVDAQIDSECTTAPVDALADLAGEVDEAQLLDRLEEALRGDDDPMGALMAAVIAVDEEATAACAASRSAVALRLIRSATAMVALFPERVSSLHGFAQSRSSTMPEDAAPARLWSTIEDALAWEVAAALDPIEPAVPAAAVEAVVERLLKQGAPARPLFLPVKTGVGIVVPLHDRRQLDARNRSSKLVDSFARAAAALEPGSLEDQRLYDETLGIDGQIGVECVIPSGIAVGQVELVFHARGREWRTVLEARPRSVQQPDGANAIRFSVDRAGLRQCIDEAGRALGIAPDEADHVELVLRDGNADASHN